MCALRYVPQSPLSHDSIRYIIHHWLLRVMWKNQHAARTDVKKLFLEYTRYQRTESLRMVKSKSYGKSKAPPSSSSKLGLLDRIQNPFASKKSKLWTEDISPRMEEVDCEYLEREEFSPNYSTTLDFRLFQNVGFPSSFAITAADDKALLETYLSFYFVEDPSGESLSPFDKYLTDHYLRGVLARSKLYAGQGNVERWCEILNDPQAVQLLKDDVEIKFSARNGTHFLPHDPVSLVLELKNVPKLIVKLFEVHTENYYRQKFQRVDTSIDMDGLVAREESLFDLRQEGCVCAGVHRKWQELPCFDPQRMAELCLTRHGGGTSSHSGR